MKRTMKYCYSIKGFPKRCVLTSWHAVLLVSLIVTPLTAEQLAEQEQQAFQAATAAVEKSVVQIRTIGGLERVEKVLLAEGPTTGLIVSPDGYIVSSAMGFAQRPASILVRLAGGEQLPARIVARDWNRMLVLLKVDSPQPLSVPEAAPTDSMRVGEWAVAVGRTFRADRVDMSVGILSALRRKHGRVVQTDANVSTANYGGPLVDLHGRVLGVLTPMSPMPAGRGDKSEVAGAEYYDSGIGFAVPLEHVHAVLPRWKEGEDLHPGLLGIGLAQGEPFVTPPKISTIWPDSPAAKAGWRPDDLIVAVDGRPVKTQSQLRSEILPHYAGDKLTVTIERDGKQIESELVLTDKVAAYRHPYLGILPDRTASPEKGVGVAVRSVLPETPAAKAGLQVGNRIRKIDGDKVDSITKLQKALEKHHPKEEIELTYARSNADESDVDKNENETESKADETTVRVRLAALSAEIPDRSLLLPADDEAKPADPADKPAFELQPLKLPEFSQVAQVLRPKVLQENRSYGLLIWLAEPQQEALEARAEAWRPICEEAGVILVQAQPEDPTGWTSGDLEYLEKLIRSATGRLQSDPNRVTVAGFGKAGTLGYSLALRMRQTVRAVVSVDAPLPRAMELPKNQPGLRLMVLSVESKNTPFAPLLREDRNRLQESGYPVARWEIHPTDNQLSPADRKTITRWLDAADRL